MWRWRAGLLRASFIAKADLRSLRHIARHRQKLGGMLASEKNRLHKLLTDAGIRLGVLVSDLHGQSARAMVKALITGKTVPDRAHVVVRAMLNALGADHKLIDLAMTVPLPPPMPPGNP